MKPDVLNEAKGQQVSNWCSTYLTKDHGPLCRITIYQDGDALKIHAIAAGFPDERDLGHALTDVYRSEGRTPRLIANFENASAKSMLVVCLNSGGHGPAGPNLIECTLYTKYLDGRREQFWEQRFSTDRTD